MKILSWNVNGIRSIYKKGFLKWFISTKADIVCLQEMRAQKENLVYKLESYKYLLNYLKRSKNKNIILIGDFNIAHQEIDLARPKNNQNNVMFTQEERKQIDKIIELDFIDTFRKFNQKSDNYTWWPYAYNARQRNLGWRID